MDIDKDQKDTLSFKDLLDYTRLPTLPELLWDGVDAKAEDYRKVVERLVRQYLGQVLLDLVPIGDDVYLVRPARGYDWNDAAYWLGHALNLRAGGVVINSPSDLLRRGDGTNHADMGQAVLANLDLLGDLPELYGMGRAADALTKALEDVREVRKVRGAG